MTQGCRRRPQTAKLSRRGRRRRAPRWLARAAAVLGAAAAAGLVAAPPADAHGLAGRADLPIPEEMFAVAAAVVLVLSFVALAGLWATPRLEDVPERRLFALPRAVDVALGALGVAVLAVTVYAGLAGTDSQRDNLTPTMVYVVFWVGVPFASLLLGDVWRLVSPWRAIGRAAGWLAARFSRDGEMPEPLAYPERLGQWPAAAGIVAFGICELCWADAREPTPLAILILIYVAIQLVGMSLYGVEAWTRRGDAFGAYFSLFARLAPITRRDGVLLARPPGAGATRLAPVAGTVALLIAAIGVTAFDGGKEGPLFNDVAPELQSFFVDLGLGPGRALELAFVVGLVVTILAVAGIWWLAVEGMPRLRTGETRVALSRRLVHSLVPIAAAYVVAHYFSLLAYNGQDAWRLASDPLGDGADLFGTAAAQIDYSVVSATGIWYVQVVTLVAGHVTALVLGHDRALQIYGGARHAARSQVVMLIVMVCFTTLGLWLLSAANA